MRIMASYRRRRYSRTGSLEEPLSIGFAGDRTSACGEIGRSIDARKQRAYRLGRYLLCARLTAGIKYLQRLN